MILELQYFFLPIGPLAILEFDSNAMCPLGGLGL